MSVALLGEVEIQPRAAARLERHVVLETGLLRERLEQRRHAADAFVVQVRDRVVAVEPHGRACAEREAVADEEHALARRRRVRQRAAARSSLRAAKPISSICSSAAHGLTRRRLRTSLLPKAATSIWGEAMADTTRRDFITTSAAVAAAAAAGRALGQVGAAGGDSGRRVLRERRRAHSLSRHGRLRAFRC